MLREGLRAGMSLSEYWESDPRETLTFIRARVWAADRAYRDGLSIAWHCAALYRAKEMPKLAKIMPPELDEESRPKRKKQFKTPQQEWAMWEAIALTANAQHEQRVKAGLA